MGDLLIGSKGRIPENRGKIGRGRREKDKKTEKNDEKEKKEREKRSGGGKKKEEKKKIGTTEIRTRDLLFTRQAL